ncbi:hypothetical protein HK405_000369, partial [Cladochytrium tenue]
CGWNGPIGSLMSSDVRKFFSGMKPFLVKALEVTEAQFAQLVEEALEQCVTARMEKKGSVHDSAAPPSRAHKVLIIGAGISGIVAGAQLQRNFPHVFNRSDPDSFVIIERAPEGCFGGTWHWNYYPGAECDIPSHLYSISFFPKSDWSSVWAPQSEILEYLRTCAAHYDLARYTRFGTEVVCATWQPDLNAYLVTLRDVFSGTESRVLAAVVLSAVGMLSVPKIPDIPGLAKFEGPVVHSARWDRKLDLKGKRVAVFGTGASAIQLVPEIAKVAANVTVFQRSCTYVVPKPNYKYTAIEQFIFCYVPFARMLYRLLLILIIDSQFINFYSSRLNPAPLMMYFFAWLLRQLQVRDPALRRRLTPTDPFGCKRLLISSDWFPTLSRSNVSVVDSTLDASIVCVEPHAVVTSDGKSYAVDAIALATGFRTAALLAPIEIRGVDGCSLREAWDTGKTTQAYKGVFVDGFPNLFVLYGPNTNVGHFSIIFMVECQMDLVIAGLRRILPPSGPSPVRLPALQVTPTAVARYNARLQAHLAGTAFSAGCRSWYSATDGTVVLNWATFASVYWLLTRRLNPADFTVLP